MRNYLMLLPFLFLFTLAACQKENDDPPPPADQRNPLNFSELSVSSATVRVAEYVTLTAIASGDGLTYKWTPEYGTIIGSGSTVQWNVCHPDDFTIECEVSDQYGEVQKKSVIIHVQV